MARFFYKSLLPDLKWYLVPAFFILCFLHAPVLNLPVILCLLVFSNDKGVQVDIVAIMGIGLPLTSLARVSRLL